MRGIRSMISKRVHKKANPNPPFYEGESTDQRLDDRPVLWNHLLQRHSCTDAAWWAYFRGRCKQRWFKDIIRSVKMNINLSDTHARWLTEPVKENYRCWTPSLREQKTELAIEIKYVQPHLRKKGVSNWLKYSHQNLINGLNCSDLRGKRVQKNFLSWKCISFFQLSSGSFEVFNRSGWLRSILSGVCVRCSFNKLCFDASTKVCHICPLLFQCVFNKAAFTF